MDVDGTNVRRVTDNDMRELELSWSPDGTRLVFTALPESLHPSSKNDIYIINVDRSGFVKLTTGGERFSSIDWRPKK